MGVGRLVFFGDRFWLDDVSGQLDSFDVDLVQRSVAAQFERQRWPGALVELRVGGRIGSEGLDGAIYGALTCGPRVELTALRLRPGSTW